MTSASASSLAFLSPHSHSTGNPATISRSSLSHANEQYYLSSDSESDSSPSFSSRARSLQSHSSHPFSYISPTFSTSNPPPSIPFRSQSQNSVPLPVSLSQIQAQTQSQSPQSKAHFAKSTISSTRKAKKSSSQTVGERGWKSTFTLSPGASQDELPRTIGNGIASASPSGVTSKSGGRKRERTRSLSHGQILLTATPSSSSPKDKDKEKEKETEKKKDWLKFATIKLKSGAERDRHLQDTVKPFPVKESTEKTLKETSKKTSRVGSSDRWNHHTFTPSQSVDMQSTRTTSQPFRQTSVFINGSSPGPSFQSSHTSTSTPMSKSSSGASSRLSYAVTTTTSTPSTIANTSIPSMSMFANENRNPLSLYLNLSSIQKKLAGEVIRVLEGYQENIEVDAETKRKAIAGLIDDLDPNSSTAAWYQWRSQRTLDTVFNVLKLLARRQVGTEPLAREKSLKILAMHAGILPMPTSESSSLPTRLLLTSSQLPPNAKDAFRTLCNTLYLHSSARLTILQVPEIVGGLAKFTRIRDGPEKLGDYEVMFLVLRTFLFVCSDNSSFIKAAIEEEHIVDYLVACLEVFARFKSEGEEIDKELHNCIIEVLKLIYTFTSFYTKLDHTTPSKDEKEHWTFVGSEREKEKPVPISVRAQSPFGKRFTSTMAGSANDAKKFWRSATAGVGLKKSNSLRDRSRDRRKSADSDNYDLTDEHLFLFQRLVGPLATLIIVPPSENPPEPAFDTYFKHIINALMYFPLTVYPPDCLNIPEGDEQPLFLSRFLTAFNGALAYVMDTEDNGRRRGGEEGLVGCIYILRKIARDNDVLCVKLKEYFLPDDIDRSTPLQTQTQTVYGPLLALMRSQSAPMNICSSIYEFLLSLSGRDRNLLCQQIGQTNVEKFVKNPKTLKTANWTTKDGKEVDGRTGVFTGVESDMNISDDVDEMSPEEREQMEEEMESIMNRLDRMNTKKPEGPTTIPIDRIKSNEQNSPKA